MAGSASAKPRLAPVAGTSGGVHGGCCPPFRPVHQLSAPTQLSVPRVTHGAGGSLGRVPGDPNLLSLPGPAGRGAAFGGMPWGSATAGRERSLEKCAAGKASPLLCACR